MDKLDDDIQNLKTSYKPRASFVADTMKNIKQLEKHSPKSARKAWVYIMSPLVAVLILVFTFSSLLHHPSTTSTQTQPNTSANTQTNQATPPQTNTATITPGTDDASLQSDLNSVSTSITNSQQSLNNANNAINDQQNQIAVPTN